MRNFPYKDAPRLIAKARGGTATYAIPHPRGLSSLDRFYALWRALEYLGKDYRDASKDLLEGLLEEESKGCPISTNERLRALGHAFQGVLRLREVGLDAYCDPDAPHAQREGAKHAVKTAVRTLADQRPGDSLLPDAPRAAARLLKALRNAAVHTGAMSEAPTEAPFPAGAELLDPLVCRLYQKFASCGPVDLKKAIDHFTQRQADQGPSWKV